MDSSYPKDLWTCNSNHFLPKALKWLYQVPSSSKLFAIPDGKSFHPQCNYPPKLQQCQNLNFRCLYQCFLSQHHPQWTPMNSVMERPWYQSLRSTSTRTSEEVSEPKVEKDDQVAMICATGGVGTVHADKVQWFRTSVLARNKSLRSTRSQMQVWEIR